MNAPIALMHGRETPAVDLDVRSSVVRPGHQSFVSQAGLGSFGVQKSLINTEPTLDHLESLLFSPGSPVKFALF